MSNVSFSFFDIDNQTNGWGDRIVMNTAGYTFSTPVGSTVIGAGTNADRFRNSQANNNLPPRSNAGNVQVNHAGPISSFQFVYRNQGQTGSSNQLIGLSDISFTC